KEFLQQLGVCQLTLASKRRGTATLSRRSVALQAILKIQYLSRRSIREAGRRQAVHCDHVWFSTAMQAVNTYPQWPGLLAGIFSRASDCSGDVLHTHPPNS